MMADKVLSCIKTQENTHAAKARSISDVTTTARAIEPRDAILSLRKRTLLSCLAELQC